MTLVYAAFAVLPFLAWSGFFYQEYYVPKLLALQWLAAVGVAPLFFRARLAVPTTGVALFILAWLGVCFGHGFGASTASDVGSAVAYGLGVLLVYWAAINLDRPQLERVWIVLYLGAVAQFPIALLRTGVREPALGTVGNPEFMATYLGVAFLVGLRWRRTRLWFLSQAALLAGIALAQSKGTLLFLTLYGLTYLPRPRWWLAGLGGLSLPALAWLAPAAVKGRFLLWLASGWIVLRHPLGLGPGQFTTGYFETLQDLFTRYPTLSAYFGPSASSVSDAHNLFLSAGSTFGLLGLAGAMVLAVYWLRLARRQGGALGAALVFLFFKACYTVLFPTITGALLLVFLWATVAPRTRATLMIPFSGKIPLAITGLFLLLVTGRWAFADHDYLLGMRGLYLGDIDPALVRLHRSLEVLPDDPYTLLAIGHAHFLRRDDSEMDRYLQRALRRQKSMDVYKKSAHMYFYRRSYDRAYGLYQDLNVVFPEHRTTLVKLAQINLVRHEWREAEARAREVLENQPRRKSYSDPSNLRIARNVLERSLQERNERDKNEP